MYSPYFVSKCFVPILALVATQVLIRSVSSVNMTNEYLNTKCLVNQGKYKTGDKYEKRLKFHIDMISHGKFKIGYDMFGTESTKNYSSILLQCRGDTYGSKCRSCFLTAVAELQRRCPNYKGGIIWYDQCLVEISAVKTVKKIDFDNNFYMSNKKNISGDTLNFKTTWMRLIERLTNIATDGKNRVHGMPKPFAASKVKFGKEIIYGMVQCTEDILNNACKECLIHLIFRYVADLENKRGGRAFGRSCSYRFEFYPFIDTETTLKYI